MTIRVTCECGFQKEVPEQWKGMRVKCKCGRSFVIESDGGLVEPPVTAPASPRKEETDTTPPVPPPPAAPVVTGAAATPRRGSVAAQFRARHQSAQGRRTMIVGGGAVISLLCLAALAYVLRDQFTGRTQPVASNPPKTPATADKTPTAHKQPTGTNKGKFTKDSSSSSPTSSAVPGETENREPQPSELTELEADDGLLLTGSFGNKPEELSLTEEQLTTIAELSSQFVAKSEALEAGTIELEQWYLDGATLGAELLAVLTDEQRETFLKMLQEGVVARMRLEVYAASLRPELATPSILWRIETDSAKLEPIESCSIAGTTTGHFLHSNWPNGAFAYSTSQGAQVSYEIWDLALNKRIGSCTIPEAQPDDSTLIARGGQFLVRGTADSGGDYRIQAWQVGADSAPKTKTIPLPDGDAAADYRLVDCVSNRVVCMCSGGYWFWNLDSDETRSVPFPDWTPKGLPACAVSPTGLYVAFAHHHSTTVESRQYDFLEIAIYDLDAGERLGNQVVATDYLPFHVDSLSFSYDGRELALLWDVDAPEPKRFLVQLNALNGRVIKVAGDIPASQQGYAQQHNMPRRDLIWLPNNLGWVINLQTMADTESDAAVDIDLPQEAAAGDTDSPRFKPIVDAIPASEQRLLLIIAEPATTGDGTLELRSQFIDLPKLGPFM